MYRHQASIINSMNKPLLLALLLAATSAHAQLSVQMDWKLADRCSKLSPQISVASIPADATTLAIKLVDNDVPTWNHGGGQVAVTATSMQLAAGALSEGYNGPCPPNFSSFGHDYTLQVRALNGSGAELANGSSTKTFSASKVKN